MLHTVNCFFFVVTPCDVSRAVGPIVLCWLHLQLFHPHKGEYDRCDGAYTPLEVHYLVCAQAVIIMYKMLDPSSSTVFSIRYTSIR
jgi:hypothetical protein